MESSPQFCLRYFIGLRDAFAALRVPAWIKPAIGGLGLGLLALRLPQVLGGGYGWIQEAIDGRLAVRLLLVLLVAKILALSLTVSSGGSGGVFAPSLFVGAMLGGGFAGIFHHPPAGLVIVGMAAVFGGAARVPVATLLMVAEMTGGYQLLVPAGLAVMLSFLIQIKLSSFFKYGSLYEAQVAARADSPAHRAEHVRIALRLLDQGNISLPPQVTHLHLAALLQSGLALDLPDGSQLTVGALRPESPWVGKTIQSRTLSGAIADSRIVAVLRGKSVTAGSARNHLATGRPAPADRSGASSGGVGQASRATSRTQSADRCDGRFLAARSCSSARIRRLKRLEVEINWGGEGATKRFKLVRSEEPQNLAFQSLRKGAPMRDGNVLRRHLRPAAVKLGTDHKKATWRSLRTTCATWMVEAGANPKDVQAQMRHSRIATTMDIYAQVPDSQRRAVAKMMDMMESRCMQPPTLN